MSNDTTIDTEIKNDNNEEQIILVTNHHNLITDSKFKIKDITELDYNGYSYVLLKLPSWYLQELHEKHSRKYGFRLPIDRQIEEAIREYNLKFDLPHHSTSSLLFDGKEPRKDVLLKLEKIASAISFDEHFPIFSRWEVEKIVKNILGNVDERTLMKYNNCIKNYIEMTRGQKFHYYAQYNMTGFKEAVLEKLGRKNA